MDRRRFIQVSAAASAALIARAKEASAQHHEHHPGDHGGVGVPRPRSVSGLREPERRRRLTRSDVPGTVVTPNGHTLPLREVGGVKVGHLIAEPVEHEFAPGLTAEIWGYNGGSPGPTIEATEGDRLRLYVTNRLPAPTTIHWHGVILPNGMDGIGGLTQPPILPGETFVYEFTLQYPATHMYHPHLDEMTQIAMGMVGMFIVHPLRPRGPRVDRDFALMTHEWRIDAGARRPNPLEMTDFNVLTFNHKAFPATEPLLVGRGERVRIRLGNLSPMDHHPIHIHGLSFRITATDGGYIPESAQWPETTALVPVGTTRVLEMVPTVSGDWAIHCHMTHHMMNQMGHDFPNTIGADTERLDRRMRRLLPGYMSMGMTGMGEMAAMKMPVPENSIPMLSTEGPFSLIDVGGMFTILKVRDQPEEADPLGWYEHPEGTVARLAEPRELARDGLEV